MNKLIPKLRFKEFTDEWQEKKLGKLLTKITSGNSPTNFNLNSTGGTPFLKVEDLNNNNKYQTSSRTYVANTSRGAIAANSIIFPKRGAAIMTNKVRINTMEILMDSNLMAITADRHKINLEFLYFIILKKGLYKIADTSTIPQINNKHIEPYSLTIPTISEQGKIAEFLGVVDEKVGKLEAKKKAFKKYKKGVLQAIFSQTIRFKQSDDSNYPDWEEKKLGEIAEFVKGQQLNGSELVKDGAYPMVNGGISASGYTNDYNVEAETITISEGGNSCGYVGFMQERFWCGGHCYAIQENKSNVDKLFLYQILKYNELSIKRLRVGSGLPNIQKSDLNKFELLIPNKEEQSRIAQFLTELDKKVELINKELGQAKLFKKALLQQMFV